MSNTEINEIIKAFAYGFTAEQVAEECEISVSEAEKFLENHIEEIKAKRSERHE